MQRKSIGQIVVVGAGNFGCALSQHLAALNPKIHLLTDNEETARSLNETQHHPFLFPEHQFLPNIYATHRISEIPWQEVRFVIMAIPVQAFLEGLKPLAQHFHPDTACISVSKGIDTLSGELPSQIIGRTLPESFGKSIVALSGPSFAQEIMAGQPTAVVAASRSVHIAKQVQAIFHSKNFRTYLSDDIVGLEISGALKNIIAVASGACAGLGFQKNSQAALISRGLAEIARFGEFFGAQQKTFSGLGGVGDLFLTCSSEKSRNFSLGKLVGQRVEIQSALGRLGSVAEGYYTSKAAFEIKEKNRIYAPITDAVFRVLHEKLPIETALDNLLGNTPTNE